MSRINNMKNRKCIDINKCETVKNKPDETQPCENEKITEDQTDLEKNLTKTTQSSEIGKITGKTIDFLIQRDKSKEPIIVPFTFLIIIITIFSLMKKLSKRGKYG